MTVYVSCLDQESTKKQAWGTPVGISLAGLVQWGEAQPDIRGTSLQAQMREDRRGTALFVCCLHSCWQVHLSGRRRRHCCIPSQVPLADWRPEAPQISSWPSSPNRDCWDILPHGLSSCHALPVCCASAIVKPLGLCCASWSKEPPFTTHALYGFCPFREP